MSVLICSDFDWDGELTGDYNLQTNPHDYVTTVQNRLSSVRTTANAYIQYDVIKDLQFKTSYNVDMINIQQRDFLGPFYCSWCFCERSWGKLLGKTL